MTTLPLPANLRKTVESAPQGLRQLTLIGGNGAGKSRFMEEMISLCGERAYIMNALSAFYAQREESTMAGSVDMLYREAVRQQSYMRTDAVSELDKILYMLYSEELESLVRMKEEFGNGGKKVKFRSTKLDIIKTHWERLFPGNRITARGGYLAFSTEAGDDLITAGSLSQGEKVVLYYLGSALYAPEEAVIFIDSPTLFIHPSILGQLWNSIEGLRPDCTFVYNSVDEDFLTTRTLNTSIWIKNYDSGRKAWDYRLIGPGMLTDEMLAEFGGTRRRVLFIEGDTRNSIDRRLYSLVFPEMNIRPLGSCNKVIETTRAMNDQRGIHHLQSIGIIDRDRRTEKEVEYLRRKQIMVPEVAEIENIFMLPGVIKLMADKRGRDSGKVLRRVIKEVIRMFKRHSEEQALQHVRHMVKREMECRIDARFSCITALETHLRSLPGKLEPRKHYNHLREEFAKMVRDEDYEGILRVFNHKPMLSESGVPQLLGFRTKDDYISGVLETLKSEGQFSERLRKEIKSCLRAEEIITAS